MLTTFKLEQSPLHQPSIDLLLDGDYIKQKRNIIFVGGPSTGKTHLAGALGIDAATRGARVRFYNVLDLVNQLELDKDQQKQRVSHECFDKLVFEPISD